MRQVIALEAVVEFFRFEDSQAYPLIPGGTWPSHRRPTWGLLYCAGILEVFHLPAVIRGSPDVINGPLILLRWCRFGYGYILTLQVLPAADLIVVDQPGWRY